MADFLDKKLGEPQQDVFLSLLRVLNEYRPRD